MNSIRQIAALNKRELEAGISPSASWHADYRDTAYIYVGGLPFELSEGDVITIFSQYGEPVFINLIRDKETGKSKGFAFLKYEDQRSCDLAVDNLGGATVMGRVLRVDHTRYKRKDNEEDVGDNTMGQPDEGADGEGEEDGRSESEREERRPVLKEERELQDIMEKYDDEDPMKAYLVQQKKEEVEAALARSERKGDKRKKKSREQDVDSKEDRDRRHRRRRHRSKSRSPHHRDGRSRSREQRRQRTPSGTPEYRRSRSRSRERRRRRDHSDSGDDRRARPTSRERYRRR